MGRSVEAAGEVVGSRPARGEAPVRERHVGQHGAPMVWPGTSMATPMRGCAKSGTVTVTVPCNRSNVSGVAASAMPVQVALPVPAGLLPLASPSTQAPSIENAPSFRGEPCHVPVSDPSSSSANPAYPCSPQNPYCVTSEAAVSVPPSNSLASGKRQ